jgi:probable F420-dependent oxidoreductase
MGFDLLYTWDHFHPLYGDAAGSHLECWTLLSAWAEATSRIEIGPLVSCTAYRNPHLLADMARTLDRISGGRPVLGVGAGWFRRDFDEYGYEFGKRGERLDRFAVALEEIKRRLARLTPPPIRPLPLLIGGVGRTRTMPLVARHADSWHAMFPDHPAEVEPAVEALLRACEQIGRDPASIEWGVGVEPDDLDRFLARDAERYVQMGFTQFTLGFNGPDWPVENGRRMLAWRDERNG